MKTIINNENKKQLHKSFHDGNLLKLSKLSKINAKKKEKNVNFVVFSYATVAKVMNPLGPTLGQFNVNLSEFCLKFNKVTEKLAPGLMLVAKISKKLKAKEFQFFVNPPSIKILLEILLSDLFQTDEIEKIEKSSLTLIPLEIIYDLILLHSFFNKMIFQKSALLIFDSKIFTSERSKLSKDPLTPKKIEINCFSIE